VPAAQRRRASARRPSCQRNRAAGRHRRPHKNRTLATGRAARAACARQHVRQPPPVPPARANVPRGHQQHARPGVAAGVRQRTPRTRVPLPAPAGPIHRIGSVRDQNPKGRDGQTDSAPRQRRASAVTLKA